MRPLASDPARTIPARTNPARTNPARTNPARIVTRRRATAGSGRVVRLTAVAVAGLVLLSGCAQSRPAAWVEPIPLPAAVNQTPTPQPTTSPSTKPATTPTSTAKPGTALPTVIEHGSRSSPRVALTFDADLTPQMAAKLDNGQAQSYANLKVIQTLEDGSVPATFFITGMWAQRYPDVMRRLTANTNFEFGNHTWTHGAYTANCYTLAQVPRAEMVSEITRTFEIVQGFGGRQTRYFRFPGLCYNAAALAAIAPTGVTVVQGDVISGDPLATKWEPIVRAVLDHVQSGSIIILHVTEDNAKMTDEALPPILAGLREKGLQPVRLSELMAS